MPYPIIQQDEIESSYLVSFDNQDSPLTPSTNIGGTTVSGSKNITSVSAPDIAKLAVGVVVTGTGIPANSYITTISPTSFTISEEATASGVVADIAYLGASGAGTLEADINLLRSQVKLILGEPNWYDPPPVSIKSLNDDLYVKQFIRRRQVLTDITIAASANYHLLVVGGSEPPTELKALAVATNNGVISALHGGTFGTTHSVAAVGGINSLNPKNLVRIVDATTGDAILSSNKEVYGLMQHEAGASTVVTTDISPERLMISFVRVNPTNDGLEACPVADIENKGINYAYASRQLLNSLDEQDFDPSFNFTDQAGSVDVTITNAIANQSGAASQDKDIDIQITDTFEFQFSDSVGAAIATIKAAAGGDVFEVGDDVNAADFIGHGTGNFHDDLTVDSDGTQIQIGVTAGQIDSAAAFKLLASAGHVSLEANGVDNTIYFNDPYQTAPIPLAVTGDLNKDILQDSTGGPFNSLAHLMEYAISSGATFSRADANTTTNILLDTLITSVSNLSGSLVNYANIGVFNSGTTATRFVTNTMIFINGRYMRPGLTSGANNDIYPSIIEAEVNVGAFYAEFGIQSNKNVMMLVFG